MPERLMPRFIEPAEAVAVRPARPGGAAAGGSLNVAHLAMFAMGALAVTAMVLTVHRLSMRTMVSAHGLLHSAVASRFAAGAPMAAPPENPFFAGEPLPYYWLFHYVAGWVSRLFDVHPLVAFEAMIIAAAWLVCLSAAVLARRLHAMLLPGLAMAFLVFAGANAVGPYALATRLGLGLEDLPTDGGQYLWGLAHPAVGRLGIEDPFALYQPLLFFWFNVTSRPIALALVFASATALLIYLQSGRRGALIAIALLTAAATAMSPLIGGAAAGALVCGLIAVWLLRRFAAARPADPQWTEDYARAIMAMIAGVVLAAPTAYHLVGLGDGMRLQLSRSAAVAGAASAFGLGALALVALLRTRGPQRRFLVALTVAAIVLLTANAVVMVPAGNHSNFFHAAAVLLPIVAASALWPAGASPERRPRHAWIVLLAFLPAPAAVVYGFLNRPAIALEIDGPALRRTPAEAPLARAYAWIAENTEADAVIVTDPRPPIVTAVGNMPELPALTGRDLWTAHATSYMVTPYRDAAERHDIALDLVEGAPLEAGQAAQLARLGRPIYVVSRNADDPERLALLASRFGPARMVAGGTAVFRVPERMLRASTTGGAE